MLSNELEIFRKINDESEGKEGSRWLMGKFVLSTRTISQVTRDVHLQRKHFSRSAETYFLSSFLLHEKMYNLSSLIAL